MDLANSLFCFFETGWYCHIISLQYQTVSTKVNYILFAQWRFFVRSGISHPELSWPQRCDQILYLSMPTIYDTKTSSTPIASLQIGSIGVTILMRLSLISNFIGHYRNRVEKTPTTFLYDASRSSLTFFLDQKKNIVHCVFVWFDRNRSGITITYKWWRERKR